MEIAVVGGIGFDENVLIVIRSATQTHIKRPKFFCLYIGTYSTPLGIDLFV